MTVTATRNTKRNRKNAKPPERHRFALIGAAGFIAPRHLQAIRDTQSELLAAVDPNDSVGILDKFYPDTQFFTEIERFDRYLEKQRRGEKPVEYISICSPNYLHDAHVRLALRVKAHAICEKPLVITPWNLDQLTELEHEHGRTVYTIMQLRLHPAVQALKQAISQEVQRSRRDICLTYITRRGPWYQASWKGSEEKSGGLAMNIGVHFFDMLLWIFGDTVRSQVHISKRNKMAGYIELEGAKVRWFLSVDENDLPSDIREHGGHAYRSLTVDGDEIDFSEGFADLHTESYRQILAGNGFGIDDARKAIELIYQIRNSREVATGGLAHPFVKTAWE